jgi:hypothetical protein
MMLINRKRKKEHMKREIEYLRITELNYIIIVVRIALYLRYDMFNIHDVFGTDSYSVLMQLATPSFAVSTCI